MVTEEYLSLCSKHAEYNIYMVYYRIVYKKPI